MVHRCNSLSRNVRVFVAWYYRTVSVHCAVRSGTKAVATAAIDTIALSAICTRTVCSVKAYNNNFYLQYSHILLRLLLYSCVFALFAILQCTSYYLSRMRYAYWVYVPAVSIVLLQEHGRRPTTMSGLYSTLNKTKEFGSLSMQNYCSIVASTMAAYTTLYYDCRWYRFH